MPLPLSNGDPMAKAKKKSKAKKSKAKKSKIKRGKKKPVKRAAAKAPAKKSKKAAPRKAKKAAPKKKKQIIGEGDYAASRKFDKDQASFVMRNKAKIPAMAKEAEAALDGAEGASLRAAEQEAMNRSTID
jgi:hypothetical protein